MIAKEALEGFRLSPQQRHLWLLQQETAEKPYRVQCAVGIDGRLDANLLKLACCSVTSRREILRTAFLSFTEMNFPLQIITSNGPIIHEFDLQSLPPNAQQLGLKNHMAQAFRICRPDVLLPNMSPRCPASDTSQLAGPLLRKCTTEGRFTVVPGRLILGGCSYIRLLNC